MFKTLEQLEKSDLNEFYKAQLRPHFPELKKDVKANKYHNIHVYLCKKCDALLSIVDLKLRLFTCSFCGDVGKNEYRYFPSKKEAAYYLKMRVLQKAGIVKSIDCQVVFTLLLGTGEKIIYILDFRIHYEDHVEHIDVKGKRLPEFIMKKKLIEDHFNITIIEVS